MQRKLDSFFKITTTYNESIKNCFIYDPENRSAYFAYKPEETDKYISTKCRVKLFYRPPTTTQPPVFIPTIATKLNAPVLKSNLQKAIRRHLTNIALTSTIALLQKDATEFLRRLPIIYIEDVCLSYSYPIITWLMMTDKEYKLTNLDTAIILSIVKDLCDVRGKYYVYDSEDDGSEIAFDLSHKSLQMFDHKDCLLSLYYRHLYGGTKGDMQMIQTSIYYYAKTPSEIHGTKHVILDLTGLNPTVEIIEEAIDFHPLPHMLGEIRKRIKSERGVYVNDQVIKMHIWFAESGINFRKEHTLIRAEEYKHTETWELIKPALDEFRQRFRAEYVY